MLVLEEPTFGVDVGAKAEIYRLLEAVTQAGLAVLLISSDFEEVAGIAHRALIFDRGRVSAELDRAALSVATPDRPRRGRCQPHRRSCGVSGAPPRASSGGLARFIAVWNLLILLVILVLLFTALKPDTFLTAFTFRSMANSRSINALVALAVMIPLAANQFDLSVASILGITQVLANGLQTQQRLPWPLAVVLVLLLGAGVGWLNGLLVTRPDQLLHRHASAPARVLLGLNQWYTGGRQVVGRLDPAFLKLSSMVPGIGIPAPLVYVLVIGLVLWIVFDYLPLGRYLYVIGDSPRAAALVGMHDQPADACSPSSPRARSPPSPGVVLQAQLQVGQSTVGQELMLPAFTGALLGATAIRPGRPNVWGTVLAVAVLAVAVAGLSQLGAPFFVEHLFNGGDADPGRGPRHGDATTARAPDQGARSRGTAAGRRRRRNMTEAAADASHASGTVPGVTCPARPRS